MSDEVSAFGAISSCLTSVVSCTDTTNKSDLFVLEAAFLCHLWCSLSSAACNLCWRSRSCNAILAVVRTCDATQLGPSLSKAGLWSRWDTLTNRKTEPAGVVDKNRFTRTTLGNHFRPALGKIRLCMRRSQFPSLQIASMKQESFGSTRVRWIRAPDGLLHKPFRQSKQKCFAGGGRAKCVLRPTHPALEIELAHCACLCSGCGWVGWRSQDHERVEMRFKSSPFVGMSSADGSPRALLLSDVPQLACST